MSMPTLAWLQFLLLYDRFNVFFIKGAVPLESKHLFYWEVNFVYILNNLPAANDTDNVNEVSRVKANFWQMVGQNYKL